MLVTESAPCIAGEEMAVGQAAAPLRRYKKMNSSGQQKTNSKTGQPKYGYFASNAPVIAGGVLLGSIGIYYALDSNNPVSP